MESALLASNTPGATKKFNVGDIVLVLHEQMPYEARVVQRHFGSSNGAGGFVMYTVTVQVGRMEITKNVPCSDVMEYNDDNVILAHKILRSMPGKEQALHPMSFSSFDLDLSHLKRDVMNRLPPSFGLPHAKFQFAPALQALHLEDWESVTKEYRLVPIPCAVTVRDILQRWSARRKQTNSQNDHSNGELIMSYFDAALPTMLIYRFELQQYLDCRLQIGSKSRSSPCDFYGGFHLLRLLIKLPFLLEHRVPYQLLMGVAASINDLCDYLVRNGRFIFSQMHEPASQDYIEKMRTLVNDKND